MAACGGLFADFTYLNSVPHMQLYSQPPCHSWQKCPAYLVPDGYSARCVSAGLPAQMRSLVRVVLLCAVDFHAVSYNGTAYQVWLFVRGAPVG